MDKHQIEEKSTKLTRKDLWRVFFNQLSIRTANNFERQQNAGFTQAMMPVIEKVYTDPEDKKEAYERHMELFLSQDMVTAIPIGIAAAMEEKHANEGNIPPDSINAVKTALMGPLAGLGDSLINGTARPILAGIAVSIALGGGGIVGPILFVLAMAFISLGIRYFGVFKGYSEGSKLINSLQSSGVINRISELASVAAFIIVGGFIAAIVVVNVPIEYTAGDTTLSIQETLDGLVPNILPLLFTGLMYWLLTKKKISPIVLMMFTMLFGIVGVYLGFLS